MIRVLLGRIGAYAVVAIWLAGVALIAIGESLGRPRNRGGSP
jgi:hypothetical protein